MLKYVEHAEPLIYSSYLLLSQSELQPGNANWSGSWPVTSEGCYQEDWIGRTASGHWWALASQEWFPSAVPAVPAVPAGPGINQGVAFPGGTTWHDPPSSSEFHVEFHSSTYKTLFFVKRTCACCCCHCSVCALFTLFCVWWCYPLWNIPILCSRNIWTLSLQIKVGMEEHQKSKEELSSIQLSGSGWRCHLPVPSWTVWQAAP